MDRRSFMRAAAASTGAAGLAGCLGDDEASTPEFGNEPDGPPRYDLPAYSELTPAETHTGEGVVVAHLRLSILGAVQQAHDAGRLPDEPVVRLPLSGVDPIVEAVETLSAYPFAAPLRRAINDAASGDTRAGDGATNDTLVEPGETFGANRTNTTAGNGTVENTTTENGTVDDTTGESTPDWDETGIEVSEIALADGVLYLDGSYDRSIVDARYTTEFQQVDELRGLAVYENGSGLGFAVGADLLVVPAETAGRAATPNSVLAHTLSGYTTTLDRIVDDDDGQWLFETTGPAAVSVGVWGADDPLDRVADSIGMAPEATGPVFGAADAFVTALEPTVDETGAVAGVETRFAGLFPETFPTTTELRASLTGGIDGARIHRNTPRAHLTASFSDI